MKELDGQIVLISGGAQGIGETIAFRMAQAGASVFIGDLNEKSADETARKITDELELASGQHISSMKVDTSDSSSVKQWIEAALSRWNRIDVLVNNAGINIIKPCIDMTDEEWRKVMGVNLDGVFFCSREVGKAMVRQKKGNIINIASIAAQFAFPGRLPYSTSKAGVVALTKVLATEWAPYGVRVNAIGPGYMDTELLRNSIAAGSNRLEVLEAKIPMNYIGDPMEIAETALFLASDKAGYITGQTIYVDGGFSITK